MKALLLIDLQNDFMPFGSLPVSRGDEVVDVANALAARLEFVVATQDWHPADHGSFASNHAGSVAGQMVVLGGVKQVLWPDHCVQNTAGASFHSGLDVSRVAAVVRKGVDRNIDSYSGFFDNGHRNDTGLHGLLREHGVDAVTIVGVATDYCVKYTALDAVQLGLAVEVVDDGVRSVDLAVDDGARALEEMRAAGCRILSASQVTAVVST